MLKTSDVTLVSILLLHTEMSRYLIQNRLKDKIPILVVLWTQDQDQQFGSHQVMCRNSFWKREWSLIMGVDSLPFEISLGYS